MKNFSFWNCITLLGLVIILLALCYLKYIAGVAICAIVLGSFLTMLIEESVRHWHDDDLTREKIEAIRKQNYN